MSKSINVIYSLNPSGDIIPEWIYLENKKLKVSEIMSKF